MRSLMRLGRELVYRPLPIIGSHVVIETLDSVEHVLRQLATPWLTRASVWEGCAIEAGLAKYGLLDRWCNVELAQLAGGVRGVAALRMNGFTRAAPDPDPVVEANARMFEEGCIVDLADSLGPPILKLFLTDHLSHALRSPHTLELPANYFPRPFTVTDACITNASQIWLGKHFYL